MKKFSEGFNKFTGVINTIYLLIASLCVFVLAISCCWQVISRYALEHSAAWTEEIGRYTFIWANLIGAACCVRIRNHANVSIMYDLLPKKGKKVHLCCMDILFALFGLIMLYEGYFSVIGKMGRYSAVAKVPMALVYSSVSVSGFGIILQSLNNFFIDLTTPSSKLGKKPEEVIQ